MSRLNKHRMSISEAFRMREALSTKTERDTQPVTTSVENRDMNTNHTFSPDHESDDCLRCGQPFNTPLHAALVDVPAIYVGPTIMAAFSRPKQPILIRGQRVRLRRIAADGSVSVSYDPADYRHAGCFYGTTTVITGVPLADIQKYPGSLALERMEREEQSGLTGYHVNHTTKGA